MNPSDPFEQRLARTPFRPPPSSLREQVLQTAVRSEGGSARPAATRSRPWMVDWFWPHPAAWATLGFAWLVVAVLHVTAPENAPNVPPQRVQRQVASAWTAALREQRALLQRLLQDPPLAGLPPEPGPDAQLWHPRNRSPLALV